MPTELTPATAARLGVLADQLEAEALGRLPFASGELAEALAQANAVRALASGGMAKEERLRREINEEVAVAPAEEVTDLMAALRASLAAGGKGGA